MLSTKGLTPQSASSSRHTGDDDRAEATTIRRELKEAHRLEVDSDSNSVASFMRDSQSTSSITSNIYHHVEENGRTYHRYKEGQYPLPNDQPEQDRLDFQHRLYYMTLNEHLHIAPITKNPKYVLDVATGTGIWAIEFAQEHPDCHVLGTDITPIQPHYAPENVFFEICDAEDEWGFTTPFDLIHMRAITSCFQNPKAVFASALKSLAPGGYIHLRDPILPFRYLTPPPDDCALKKWNDLLIEAAEKAGRRWTDAHNYRDWLVELGYRDVVEIIERVPLSPWAKGQRMKVISLWLQQDMLAGVEGMTMALLTRVLGWKVEDVRVFLEQVMKDMQDTSLHAYAEGVIVYGRRPYDGEE